MSFFCGLVLFLFLIIVVVTFWQRSKYFSLLNLVYLVCPCILGRDWSNLSHVNTMAWLHLTNFFWSPNVLEILLNCFTRRLIHRNGNSVHVSITPENSSRFCLVNKHLHKKVNRRKYECYICMHILKTQLIIMFMEKKFLLFLFLS